MAILDTFNLDVRIVEHEVICPHSSTGSVLEERCNCIIYNASVAEHTLLSDPIIRCLDHLRAERATLERGEVDLVVESLEVYDGLHHSRRGPRSNSQVRVARLEPG